MSCSSHNAQQTVALVCSRFHPSFSGPGIAFMRSLPHLEEEGLHFIVLTMKQPGAPETEKISCMDIVRCGGAESRLSQFRFIAGVLWQLILRRRCYQSIHVFHSGWLSFLVPLVGKLLGKRTCFVMTLLNSDDPEQISKLNMATLKLRLFRLYHRVIYINPEQARRYERIYGTREPLISGSMGIDLNTFRPALQEERWRAREELGIEREALVAAFSGAIIRRKGIDLAVEIWLRVAKERPQAVLLVLGPEYTSALLEASLYSQLTEQIAASGMSDHFHFLWSPPDMSAVRRLLHAADLFLFPSRNEGTPSAVMEAMACGVVPVLFPLDGFTGVVVRDGSEGVVLQPDNNMDAAAGRVLRLLDDSASRKIMGRQARERVRQTHSQEVALAALMRAWGLPSRAE